MYAAYLFHVCDRIMNEIRLYGVIQERYNTHFRGLLNRLIRPIKSGTGCSYCKTLTSTPARHTMQKSLKLKLQNVLSQINQADAESPALIVGGRRRNRKKRRHRNVQAARRKNKRGGEGSSPVVTPTGTNEDKPSCLDIEEPVFYQKHVQPDRKYVINYDQDVDSLYNSNESLVSDTSNTSFNGEKLSTSTPEPTDDKQETAYPYDDEDEEFDDEELEIPVEEGPVENNIEAELKNALPRLHSRDSGIFDDDDEDLFAQDQVARETGHSEVEEEDIIHETRDNKNEMSIHDDEDDQDHVPDEKEYTDVSTLIEDKKTDVQIDEEKESDENETQEIEDFNTEEELDAAILPTEQKIHPLQLSENSGVEIEKNTVVEDNEAEEVLFDLTALEVNTTENFLSGNNSEKTVNNQLTFADVSASVEAGEKLQINLEDFEGDDDVVIFEARTRAARAEDLTITCNPLYEQVLKQERREEEEGDEVSIQKYQSGYGPVFEKHNIVTVPVSVSSQQKYKESSPLISHRKSAGNKEDEIACCVIL